MGTPCNLVVYYVLVAMCPVSTGQCENAPDGGVLKRVEQITYKKCCQWLVKVYILLGITKS